MELVDDLTLAGLGNGEVNLDALGGNTEGGRVLEGATNVGRLEELLGGNAPTVEARAANLVTLNQSDVQPCGGAIEGSGVATGASANDNNIELLNLVRHDNPLT